MKWQTSITPTKHTMVPISVRISVCEWHKEVLLITEIESQD